MFCAVYAYELEKRTPNGIDRIWVNNKFAEVVNIVACLLRTRIIYALYFGIYQGLRKHAVSRLNRNAAENAL